MRGGYAAFAFFAGLGCAFAPTFVAVTLPLETFVHAFLMTQRLAVTGNSLSF